MPQEQQASTKAILSLVFAILNFVALPCIGAIVAVVLGKGETSGVGRAGYVIGWIGLALAALGTIAFFVMMALGIAISEP